MTLWAFVLAPLALLPVILLFRFVGCGLDVRGTAEDIPLPERKPPVPPDTGPEVPPPPVHIPPPNYQAYVLGLPSVIAYWRLTDAPASTTAEDLRKFQDGEYKDGYALAAIAPTQAQPGSKPRNPAYFVTGQDSLIDSDLSAKCRLFEGGHVFVPFKPGLYSDEFTIEAWIKSDGFETDFQYTLFDAGGNYAVPPSQTAQRGFRLFINREKSWQVRLGQTGPDLFASPPIVPPGGRSHVALTVEVDGADPLKKKVSLYLDGKLVGPVTADAYLRPDNAALFIGVENDQPNPATAPRLKYPLLSRVQEVVLHGKALSESEIKMHVEINRK
jgi:hypothetical protein